MELSEGLHLCLKLKDMEIKDNKLIIDIPKGMEVDTENTDEAKGVIMLRKKKVITYEDVVRFDFSVDIKHKIEAIQKLTNIAKYYNRDWEPDWRNNDEDKNFIYYNYHQGGYTITAEYSCRDSNVYFKNVVDAQAVIDNPNFRQILDAIYKG